MRSDLTTLQSNILDADVKERTWLMEVDVGATGSVDYYWSTKDYTFNGQAYTGKPIKWTPLKISRGLPEKNIFPASQTTITIPCQNDQIDGHYSSDFKGAAVTIKLIMKANLSGAEDVDVTEEDVTVGSTYEAEEQILAFTLEVVDASHTYQIQTWHCRDFMQKYVQGDYPNTNLISDAFPADIMKDDSVCVPASLGTCYFPLRWAMKWFDVTYVDSNTFTISGDYTTVFAAGYWLKALCGVDGNKSGWVASNSYSLGTTTVNLTAGSDNLTANLTQVMFDFYVLGDSSPEYTISSAKVPVEASGVQEYSSGTYTFKQDTIPGEDGNNYKIVRLIIDDANLDDTDDANGYWGPNGSPRYDVPFKLSRPDTSSMTNPANQAEYFMEAFGTPSAQIDDTAKATAAAVFTARSFSMNIPIWYQIPRKKLLCKLFAVSGMVPIIRDKIYLKVLSPTSQLAIEKDLVIWKTFKIGKKNITEKQKDSGYVVWQKTTLPTGQKNENKSLVAVKSSTSSPAATTIECEWVNDDTGVKAQKAGKLALQRSVLPEAYATFSAKTKILKLEPGDMISINQDDHGAEGSSYDVMIDEMSIPMSGPIGLKCTIFSDTLDAWDDLSASAITVGEADNTRGYSPVYQGGVDANDSNNEASNVISQTVIISGDGVLKTNKNPASNGGFEATNSTLTCYNTDGDVRFQAIYSGDNQGDVIIGDYSGGSGAKWRQDVGTFNVKGLITSTGGNIAGWAISQTEIKKITSNAGVSVNSSFPAIVLTDANSYQRVFIGKTGFDYGLIIRDEANNVIAQIDDNTKIIAGWTPTATQLGVGTDIILDATNKAISINNATFGQSGMQFQYNAGSPRFYAGNGSNEYLKYDSSGIAFKTASAGRIQLLGGADLELTGSDSDPAVIKWGGATYSVDVGIDYSGNDLLIVPSHDGLVEFHLGVINGHSWADGDKRFIYIYLRASDETHMISGELGAASSVATVETASAYGSAYSKMYVQDDSGSAINETILQDGVFYPNPDKGLNLGKSNYAWDDAYADDWNNVADFYFMDHRKRNGQVLPVNDLAIINNIKPSGIFDERSGLEIIDDNSIPGWMFVKDKLTGEIARDGDGKPYLSLKTVDSLLMGAIRQLSEKITELEKRKEPK